MRPALRTAAVTSRKLPSYQARNGSTPVSASDATDRRRQPSACRDGATEQETQDSRGSAAVGWAQSAAHRVAFTRSTARRTVPERRASASVVLNSGPSDGAESSRGPLRELSRPEKALYRESPPAVSIECQNPAPRGRASFNRREDRRRASATRTSSVMPVCRYWRERRSTRSTRHRPASSATTARRDAARQRRVFSPSTSGLWFARIRRVDARGRDPD